MYRRPAYTAVVPLLACLSLQVCIVLRMMAEEVTQYRDDLEADNKRQLLSALTACVPQVLPFLEQNMEGHFRQAVAAAQQGQHQMSQLHAAVVTAALGTPHHQNVYPCWLL